jgi:hypothetical protein
VEAGGKFPNPSKFAVLLLFPRMGLPWLLGGALVNRSGLSAPGEETGEPVTGVLKGLGARMLRFSPPKTSAAEALPKFAIFFLS